MDTQANLGIMASYGPDGLSLFTYAVNLHVRDKGLL